MTPRMPSPPTRPSTRWAWMGAGLGLTLALITKAPAYWLANALAQVSGQRMLLQDPQGTVWQGSAQWALNEGPISPSHTLPLPTRVRWQLSPRLDWTNGRPTLSASVSAACCTPQPVRIDVSPLWRGLRVQVQDHTSQWPAHWLVGLGAPWNTVQPEGTLQVQTRQLQWLQQAGTHQLQGQAELQLQHLATRLSTLRPLGSYRLRLMGDPAPVAVELDTLEGSLRLKGSGQFLQGHLRFNGEASAAPDAEAALSNLLNILGDRRGTKSILKMG